MALKRQLGKLEVFSIAAGAMISSGIFILPAIAYKEAGIGVLLAYFFAGVLMLPALFSNLELATALPKSGGIYFFAERILGTAAGEVTGFANWFSLSMKSAFALIGIGAFATLLDPSLNEFQIKIIAAAACIFFGLVNLVSVKASGRMQIIMVFILLIILAAFIILGYPQIDYSNFSFSGNILNWSAIFSTTGMVFISYGGLTKVASVAEEVKDIRKNLVQGMIAAFLIVQSIYMLVLFVVIGVTPADVLSTTLTPVSTAAVYIFSSEVAGKVFMILTASAAMLAFITTANAGIMTASRSPMAMGRDGLLPEFFSSVSKKSKTPFIAVILTTLFMLTIILALPIVKLVKVASLFMLLLFFLLNLSVIIIRSSKILNYKPTFKTPLYPVPQIVGSLLYLVLIIQMGLFTMVFALVFIALSLLWFFIYANKNSKRKSALVYLIENITNPELTVGESELELENELLDILIDRNEIVEDRFDSIIRDAPVIDYEHTVTRDDFFNDVAGIISEKMNLEKTKVVKKLHIREEEASTLIFPGVALPHAIPHVIVEGTHLFDIVLARNKYGIEWNENGDIVYTAFCLIGSKDERTFHLKALAAIAQVLMDPSFDKEWNKAKNLQDLRTAILLVKRRREG